MIPAQLHLDGLRALYESGAASPRDVVEEVIRRQQAAADPAIFITATAPDALRSAAEALLARAPEPNSLPLWGIPFAVKDNIDVAGLPTTAACPAFAYVPAANATVVQRLLDAGALVIGKTNLDQFATGLNGTRSPYGAPRNVFDPDYISGGSSSGSAVAVASGLAAFALGTDTAGSGRVPAAFNNIVGIKPTPGLLSTAGVVPACRSLDCVTVMANTVADGVAVRRVAEAFDAADPFSRPSAMPVPMPADGLRLGVPEGVERNFFGDTEAERLYDAALTRARDLGATLVPVDYAPFREVAALLYDGPWVAERLAAVETFFAANESVLDPSVRAIIGGGRRYSALDAFKGFYALQALRRQVDAEWDRCDLLLLPTAPTTYRVAAMQADPIRLNANLGLYTNFANLLGCSAIAVPAGFRSDGIPFGVTLVGRASQDDGLGTFADALHRGSGSGMGRQRSPLPDGRPCVATGGRLELVAVGAHLSGMPLNRELLDLGGRLERACRTAPGYKLFALPGTVPPKPGMVQAPGFAGPGIAVEVWSLPEAAFGRFVQAIPAPLGIGKVTLDDGSQCSGFLCEGHAVETARDVTAFGGWRAFVEAVRLGAA